MKNKLFTLLTLLLFCTSATWADATWSVDFSSKAKDWTPENNTETLVVDNYGTVTETFAVGTKTDVFSTAKFMKFSGAAVMLTITLPAGKTFKAGDKLQIIGKGGKSSKPACLYVADGVLKTPLIPDKTTDESGSSANFDSDEMEFPENFTATQSITIRIAGSGETGPDGTTTCGGALYLQKVIYTEFVTTTATFVCAHGTTPNPVSAANVTLPDQSEAFWTNTGWIADQNVTISDATVAAGTLITCGSTVHLLSNTTFTAQWNANATPIISGVTLPGRPEGTLNLATQTTYAVTNGYMVELFQTLRNGGSNWLSQVSGGSASGQTWTAPESSVFTSVSDETSVTALMVSKKTYAIQFTGTTEFQALMNSRHATNKVHVLLADYTDKTTEIIDITGVSNNNSPELSNDHIASFTNLDPTHVYVAYFYGYNDSGNGLVYEIAFAATHNRNVTNGNWGTICLPYAVNSYEGATFYTINSVSAASVTVSEVTELEAGKPYLFKATAEKLVAKYNGVAVNAPVANNGLVGNLGNTPIELDVDDNAYILSANEFHHIEGTATASVGQFRAYLQGSAINAPSVIRIVEEENNTTSISDVEATEQVVKFFENGQLFIKKNGVIYTTTGAVVK